MWWFVRKAFDDRKGATAIEYALIAALIAGVIAVAVGALGLKLSAFFINAQSIFP